MRLLSWLAAITGASGALIGIDYGNEFFKVSMIQPGKPIEIVSNIHSKRKTDTAVSFFEPVRVFGSDALNHDLKAKKKVYVNTNAALGYHMKSKDENVLNFDQKFYPADKIGFNETRQSVSFPILADRGMHPEELHAHLLSHAKEIAETANDGGVITEGVITIPANFNQRQRQAIVHAAEIAGLSVTLIPTTTAAAIQRALDWKSNSTQQYLFYNMGSRSTEACVFEYSNRETGMVAGRTAPAVVVKGCAVDNNLGGHFADMSIASKMMSTFQTKHPKNAAGVTDTLRPWKKLLYQAKKTKHILSANKEAPFNVASFHDDVDFSTSIKRSDFEEMIKPLIDNMAKVSDEALKKANVTLGDIDQIEILGGSWRVPAYLQQLETLYKNPAKPTLELGQHLNGEEAPALGAALFGANMSSIFRVRRMFIQDVVRFDYAMEITAKDGSEIRNRTMLAEKNKNKINFKKKISFQQDDDFTVKLFEDDTLISTHAVAVADARKKHEAVTNATRKVSFTIAADLSGIITVGKAEHITEESFEDEVLDKDAMAAKKAELEKEAKEKEEAEKKAEAEKAVEGEEPKNEGEEEKKEGEEPKKEGEEEKKEGEEEKKEGEEPKKEGEEPKKEGEEAKKEGEEKKDEKKEKKKKPEIKVDNIYMRVWKKRKLPVNCATNDTFSFPLPLTTEDIALAKDGLRKAIQADKDAAMMDELKNDIESSIYSFREKLENEHIIASSTEENRNKISEECGKMQVLVDDDFEQNGEKLSLDTLREKFNSFKYLMSAIEERGKETEERPDAVKQVEEDLKKIDVLKKQVKEMKWINETRITAQEEKTEKFVTWWNEIKAKQDATPGHEAPHFTAKEVRDKSSKQVVAWEKLSKTKKPKEKKEEKKKPEVKLDLKGKEKDELLKMYQEFTEQKMKAVADQKFDEAHVLKEKEKLVMKALKKLGVTPPKTEETGTKDAKEEEAKKTEESTEDGEAKEEKKEKEEL